MRSASQLAVYETYEESCGRKSTLDELKAEIAEFTQQSMLWMCATIMAGMQLWDKVDNQPAQAFETLVRLYFDPPLRGRLLAGHFSANPRRVLFHRRQILLIAKLAIKNGNGGKRDVNRHAEKMGSILLKANDQLAHGLLNNLPQQGHFPNTREELSKVVVEMLATGEDGPPNIQQMMTRNHLMMTRFVGELRGHSDWIDIDGEYKQATGLTLEEREAMVFGVHSRFGPELSKTLYREPGALPLKEGDFSATAVESAKVSMFLDSVAGTPHTMAMELQTKDNGANDIDIFRKYPLVKQFYNIQLSSAWVGFLMMNTGFLLEKALTGPYWHAVKQRGQAIHRFWGAVFESYVQELMIRGTDGTQNRYIPDPRQADDLSVQLCDGIVIAGDSLVLLEYKGTVFRADTKYGGDYVAMADEIEKKLVRDHQSKKKKGVEQLAFAVKTLFGPKGNELFPDIETGKVKRVYLYMVTLDSVGGTIGMSALLNTFLDQMLDRSAYPMVEIRPLFCSEVEALEDLTMLFSKRSLPDILERWFRSNPQLIMSLQAVDFGKTGWKENAWLREEWINLYRGVVKILFPNENPEKIAAMEEDGD
jgi:hypothetical protein